MTDKSNNSERILTGAQALMEAFIAEGVETIFGYPGGAIIPVYDALYDYQDKFNHILARHEQGAIHAAQGYARVSGKVGVVIVTSGPGATNTVTGLGDAMMDSTPLVVISGQVASTMLGTDAFQEANFIGMTQPVVKWNIQIKRAEDIPAAVAKAFYVAQSGRPGPVVIDFTKDAQLAKTPYKYKKYTDLDIRSYRPYPHPEMDKIDEAARLIDLAKKPVLMIGQGVILGNAEKELLEFINKSGMPVASTMLGLSAIPSQHPQYIGMLGMHGNYGPNIKNKDYDLIVAVGMRFDDRVTSKVSDFGNNAKVIHMDIDPSEINKIIYTDVDLIGDAKTLLPLLTDRIIRRKHTEWINEFHSCEVIENETITRNSIHPLTPCLKMAEVVNAVSEAYNHDAIMVTDVGQQQMAAVKYFKFSRTRSVVTSGGMGTMGFGLPAAIGAKLGAPEREVVLFVGDGGLQMTIQEMCTAMQSNVKIKIVLLNNTFLGMVRQWQDLFFRKRYSFTHLENPDFEYIAKANKFGYSRITAHSELEQAVEEMKNYDGPYLLEACCEKEENIFPMVPAGAPVNDIRLE